MKIFVLTSNTIYDCDGDVYDEGKVIGVFSTYELAETNIPATNWGRTPTDYEINEYTLDE